MTIRPIWQIAGLLILYPLARLGEKLIALEQWFRDLDCEDIWED